MLNRRHLRVKVLQSLYAFVQSGNEDLIAGEKELLFGIEKIYDLYLYQFMLLSEMLHQAERQIDDNRSKHLPSQSDLHPNTRFSDNQCLLMIASSEKLLSQSSKRKINWKNDQDVVRKFLLHVQQQAYYQEYLQQPATGFDSDRAFVIKLIKKDLMHFELLHFFYEEKSIYWLDDWELVNKMLIKTLLQIPPDGKGSMELLPLFKEDADREFALALFDKTILGQQETEPLIANKTQNWDIERIALMDIIIMKMAVTEILKFNDVPVKVSLNEYIELSKMYSTPKSKQFINGVLDKLVEDFVKEKKISMEVKGLS